MGNIKYAKVGDVLEEAHKLNNINKHTRPPFFGSTHDYFLILDDGDTCFAVHIESAADFMSWKERRMSGEFASMRLYSAPKGTIAISDEPQDHDLAAFVGRGR